MEFGMGLMNVVVNIAYNRLTSKEKGKNIAVLPFEYCYPWLSYTPRLQP